MPEQPDITQNREAALPVVTSPSASPSQAPDEGASLSRLPLPENATRADEIDQVFDAFQPDRINAVLVQSKAPQLADLSPEVQLALLSKQVSFQTENIQVDLDSDEKLQAALGLQKIPLQDTDRQFIASLRQEILALLECTRDVAGANSSRLLIETDLYTGGMHVDPAVIATRKIFGPTTEFLATEDGEYDVEEHMMGWDPDAQVYWSEQDEILIHYGYRPASYPPRDLPFPDKVALLHQKAERESQDPNELAHVLERFRVEEPEGQDHGKRKYPSSLTIVVATDL